MTVPLLKRLMHNLAWDRHKDTLQQKLHTQSCKSHYDIVTELWCHILVKNGNTRAASEAGDTASTGMIVRAVGEQPPVPTLMASTTAPTADAGVK